MKNKQQLITSILAITFISYLVSVAIDTENIKTSYAYEVVERPHTLIYTLDNGLKVYLSINKDEPRIQTNIAVNTGINKTLLMQQV